MGWEELFRGRIRELIEERYPSIDRFYLESGISKGHIYEILSGKTNPSLTTLKKLADALEIDVRDFFILPERGQVDQGMEFLREAGQATLREVLTILVKDAEKRAENPRRRRSK